tara:strand:+ start:69 stop:272 length:204 start_codon:yes stop_codon:yes gene_type:complete
MAIFGFICGVLILGFLTLGWVFVSAYDGAFGGKREIPVYWMLIVLCLLGYGWCQLISASPFAITVVT